VAQEPAAEEAAEEPPPSEEHPVDDAGGAGDGDGDSTTPPEAVPCAVESAAAAVPAPTDGGRATAAGSSAALESDKGAQGQPQGAAAPDGADVAEEAEQWQAAGPVFPVRGDGGKGAPGAAGAEGSAGSEAGDAMVEAQTVAAITQLATVSAISIAPPPFDRATKHRWDGRFPSSRRKAGAGALEDFDGMLSSAAASPPSPLEWATPHPRHREEAAGSAPATADARGRRAAGGGGGWAARQLPPSALHSPAATARRPAGQAAPSHALRQKQMLAQAQAVVPRDRPSSPSAAAAGPAAAAAAAEQRVTVAEAVAAVSSQPSLVSGRVPIACGRFDWDLPTCSACACHGIREWKRPPGADRGGGERAAHLFAAGVHPEVRPRSRAGASAWWSMRRLRCACPRPLNARGRCTHAGNAPPSLGAARREPSRRWYLPLPPCVCSSIWRRTICGQELIYHNQK
jgi:hypothetical protein